MKDSTEAWLLVSGLLSGSADPGLADATLEHVLSLRETASSGDVSYARSQLAVRSGNLQQAFELAQQAVEENPRRIEFLTWAGRLALNLKQPEAGLEYIRRAWQLDPEDHDLALAYADLLARTGDPDGARRIMREMTQTPDVMLSRILFEIAAADRQAAAAWRWSSMTLRSRRTTRRRRRKRWITGARPSTIMAGSSPATAPWRRRSAGRSCWPSMAMWPRRGANCVT
jgi:tetratricopeptide (TPR) repeat protein